MKALMVMCGNGKVQSQYNRIVRGHKPAFRIIFSSNQIRHLLPQIRPFLITKRQQADLLLRFLDLKAKSGPRMVSDAQWVEYEELRAQIRTLNIRGFKDTAAAEMAIRAQRFRRPDPNRKRCGEPGCDRFNWKHGYCSTHHYKHVGKLLYEARGPYQKQCVVCDRLFTAYRSDSFCCSKKCGSRKRYLENAEAIKATVAAYKQRRKQQESPQT
jgi:hypothetical protein